MLTALLVAHLLSNQVYLHDQSEYWRKSQFEPATQVDTRVVDGREDPSVSRAEEVSPEGVSLPATLAVTSAGVVLAGVGAGLIAAGLLVHPTSRPTKEGLAGVGAGLAAVGVFGIAISTLAYATSRPEE